MTTSRLNGNSSTDLADRIDALKRIDEELKAGRAYTSGRSGVLAYTIPNNDNFDVMDIRTTTAPAYFDDEFVLPPTGSMSFGYSFKLWHIYHTLNQEYPVVSPYLEIYANGVKLEQNLQGNFTAGDNGATWGVGTYFSYLDEIPNWDVPNEQSWNTFLSWFSLVPITIQTKMRVKSTDKGTIENIAVIF